MGQFLLQTPLSPKVMLETTGQAAKACGIGDLETQ
jgi:hypothetical protein